MSSLKRTTRTIIALLFRPMGRCGSLNAVLRAVAQAKHIDKNDILSNL